MTVASAARRDVLLYNTLTGAKEPLKPKAPGRVGMYVCGVTVYDLCHIGHARSAIVFDVLVRYLESRGFRVTYVRNFTDVDDKIIARATRDGLGWREIADRYIDEYYLDMDALGVRRATYEPKATEHIPDMIALIEGLIEKEMAYVRGGDVYFRVARFPRYGRLSGRRLDQLRAGARVEVDERKEDPLDFALWKASKPGEPSWESPWGPGRPGWHIECSAMAMAYLGQTIDLHGGGQDLTFPHHENEIAQSEGYTGVPFARCWVHNGFVTINEEKMSKSLGNFFTIREILEKAPWGPTRTSEALRYLLLGTHYRSPLDFSDESLKSAIAGRASFYDLLGRLDECKAEIRGSGDRIARAALDGLDEQFDAAMSDDLNTPQALGVLHHARTEFNRAFSNGMSLETASEAKAEFLRLAGILGLKLQGRESEPLPGALESKGERPIVLSEDDITRRVDERNAARARNDWTRADAIRKELADAGITIEDRPDGTTRVKR